MTHTHGATAASPLDQSRRAEHRRTERRIGREQARRLRNMETWATAEQVEAARRQFERDRRIREVKGGSNRMRRAYGPPFQRVGDMIGDSVIGVDDYPPNEQLPRSLDAVFVTTRGPFGPITHLSVNNRSAGRPLGDHGREEGSRWHNALHLAFSACLGWSPVVRTMLHLERLSDPLAANIEDGPNARAAEEQIAWAAFLDARARGWYVHTGPGQPLLRRIRDLTARLEVGDRTEREWRHAVRSGVDCMRQLAAADGGVLYGDMALGTLSYESPAVGV